MQRDHRRLFKVVEKCHAVEFAGDKTKFHAFEPAASIHRNQAHPRGPVFQSRPVKPELRQRLFVATEQQGRRVRQRCRLRFYSHLGEVDVVTPDIDAIRNELLLVGLDIAPAKLARPFDFQRAVRSLDDFPAGIHERLLETALQGFDVLDEVPDQLLALVIDAQLGRGGIRREQ